MFGEPDISRFSPLPSPIYLTSINRSHTHAVAFGPFTSLANAALTATNPFPSADLRFGHPPSRPPGTNLSVDRVFDSFRFRGDRSIDQSLPSLKLQVE